MPNRQGSKNQKASEWFDNFFQTKSPSEIFRVLLAIYDEWYKKRIHPEYLPIIRDFVTQLIVMVGQENSIVSREFEKAEGESMEKVRDRALGGSVDDLCKIIAWDKRILFHPSTQALILDSEWNHGTKILKAIGQAIKRNRRYSHTRQKKYARLIKALNLARFEINFPCNPPKAIQEKLEQKLSQSDYLFYEDLLQNPTKLKDFFQRQRLI